ncbi:tRNA lysidine(34) synthetase TilS [Buchnera aphidicola]|uniref:tRNA lysidine(34) synthetase TilS n=1 Tax=Buchnera aphidicola TaxID=9 RepID=UPI0034648438
MLAYSGGLDSTVLFHQLIKLKNEYTSIEFRTIHINHNMHPKSDQWSIFCQKICKNYDIDIVIDNIPYLKKNIYGIEADLRNARYTIIKKHLKQKEILLTAHHLNDQCETFFLALKRGSGPTGLSCMPYKKNIGNNIHCRPLLMINKQAILHWAYENKLNWLSDPNNKNIKFDRNFLREIIIPKIEKKWPFFIKNLNRSIQLCNNEKKILNEFTIKKFNNCLSSNGSLSINNLNQYNTTMINLILRHWIKFHKQEVPSYQNTNNIYKKIISINNHDNACIQFQKYEIRRYRNHLYLIIIQNKINNLILFWKNHHKPLILPNKIGMLRKNKYGNNLPKPNLKEIINIRFKIESKTKIKINNKTKMIKKLWQNIGIPIWERKKIPLIYYNNFFITALGYFINQDHNLKKRQTWNISWENYIKK